MRLIRRGDDGALSLIEYYGDNLPPYAILSHTWRADGDEVTFRDLQDGSGKSKAGYAKILFCARQAAKDDLKDFWVDTCCINKDSETELSEALNSMFRWYRRASKCYVYLEDVSALKCNAAGQNCNWQASFRKSRWFTRGWTLQELLAPRVVEFYSRDETLLGVKESLKETISEITGVPTSALLGAPLSSFTVNERLRWASKRETKRKEDIAYCLLGVFGVFLPPIYGEGENAFRRLRQELEKSHSYEEETYDRGLCYGDLSNRNRTTLSMTAEYFKQDENARQKRSRLERRQELLASLRFDRIDARHSAIKIAQRTTCEWILRHTAYEAWIDRDNRPQGQGILRIVGKPGAGKSTLMKFALANAKNATDGHEIHLAFFFNARGEGLEKTTLGMYRSLLLQLLSGAPDLQHVLDSPIIPAATLAGPSPWTLDNLQYIISNTVRGLGRRRVGLFIDALDECDGQQVRDMVEFFEDLEGYTIHNDSRVSICFSSRHYPTIKIHYGWQVVLENEAGHADDLRKYIRRRLEAGEAKLIGEIQEEVQRKAKGVFMWVVLVVEILNQEFRRGRIFAVRQRLEEIPTDLSELFRDLLKRDRVHIDELQLCLQWILFAERPLRPEEFYFAMLTGLHRRHNPDKAYVPMSWNPDEVTQADMCRFVVSSSKGLAEVIERKHQMSIQFIHESVRDFLLKDGGMRDLWPGMNDKVEPLSHETLKQCCHNYLNIDLPSTMPEMSRNEKTDKSRRVDHDLPFLEYASAWIFQHAQRATPDINQDAFVRKFPVLKWIRAIKRTRFNGPFYSPEASLLYIFATENCPSLMYSIYRDEIWTPTPAEAYPFPVIAAFAHGNPVCLEALLGFGSCEPKLIENITRDEGFGKRQAFPPGADLLEWAIENRNWSLAECLLLYQDANIYSVTAEKDRYATALQAACSNGNQAIVSVLLRAGADVNAQKGYFGNALQTASYEGHVDVVRMLLDGGADVNVMGGFCGNALQAASRAGNLGVVRLLLEAGANVSTAGGEHSSALQAAAEAGHKDVVQTLLTAGAVANAYRG